MQGFSTLICQKCSQPWQSQTVLSCKHSICSKCIKEVRQQMKHAVQKEGGMTDVEVQMVKCLKCAALSYFSGGGVMYANLDAFGETQKQRIQ